MNLNNFVDKKYIRIGSIFLFCILFGCTVSYKFNGATIDYDKIKTISFKDFTNQAELVYAPLEYKFNEALKDSYRRQTKLKVVPQNGDLHLEGEITGYNLTSMGVTNDNFAATSKLTMTVRVRYTNKANPREDLNDQTFSSSATFPSSQMLSDREDELTEVMVKDIVNMIFNATVANW